MKKCSKCGLEKEELEFSRDKNRKDGLYPYCRSCCIQVRAENMSRNCDYYKKYEEKRKPKNSDRCKKYYHENQRKIMERHVEWTKRKYKSDLSFRIERNMRNRLNMAVKGKAKGGSFTKSLGCSFNELRSYIASKFQIGMSWENYGLHGWHLDHIRPLSSFDLSDPEQFAAACHFTNLQPLWALDNIKKVNKVE